MMTVECFISSSFGAISAHSRSNFAAISTRSSISDVSALRVSRQRCRVWNDIRCSSEADDLADFRDLRQRLRRTNIYFVGMMGSGKSVTAAEVASKMQYRFLDSDSIIERLEGRPISEIFKEKGEEYFRDIESAVLEEMHAYVACCIATGGGIVVNQRNWSFLQTGIVVWLDASADTLYTRLQKDTSRPLLQTEDPKSTLENILEQRIDWYKLSDVRVPVTEDITPAELAKEVCRRLCNFIKENPPRFSEMYPSNLSNQGGDNALS
mmetsp:Transcript_7782/g.14136  ORF Transcript_7782/g.14136 Transcript_7782/m.14136 type:complete len:266 (-) Transcript_7782:926-1723(-)